MKNYKIVPLSKAFAQRIRLLMVDDFGHAVTEKVAAGAGPCRVSLKPFRTGVDKRLLLSHSPFETNNAYNQPGPVFINSEEVEEYSDVYRFPPEIKADKISFPLSFIGYDEEQQMALSRLVGDFDIDTLIEKNFDTRADIDYLHVRNSEACCFICKIERLVS